MNTSGKHAVIIVAAGRGSRMAASFDTTPKQYRLLAGKVILTRTLQAFIEHPQISHIVVCIHVDDEALYGNVAPDHDKLLPPIHGGATRQLSVFIGLQALAKINPDTVLIHDAVRHIFVNTALNGFAQSCRTSRA